MNDSMSIPIKAKDLSYRADHCHIVCRCGEFAEDIEAYSYCWEEGNVVITIPLDWKCKVCGNDTVNIFNIPLDSKRFG